MKKSTAFVFAALAVFAASAVTREEYPDADLVLVDSLKHVEYRPNGTYDATEESWMQVLTEKGKRDAAEVRVDFNRRSGDGDILYVGIISPDGTEREIDVSGTKKETTDNSYMSMNIYDPLDRKIIATVPGLKIGDTVHSKTRVSMVRPRFSDHWSDTAIMEWTYPIVRSVYEVVAPASLPLKKSVVRNPLGNITEEKLPQTDGSVLWRFTARNSPQVFTEPMMPSLETQVQRIMLSTAADWQEMSRWYWEVCKPHIEAANPAITNKVHELNNDLYSIFKFISQEIRYMGLTLEETSHGWAPHDASLTFDNRYGVCRDKAGLMVSMLRIAGYEAYPVLIDTWTERDPEVASPEFNHAIVAVCENGKYRLIDPTAENAKELQPAGLANRTYLVSRPEGETLLRSDVLPVDRNTLTVKSRGSLTDDGALLLENEFTMNGQDDSNYRYALSMRTDEERFAYFERIVKWMAPDIELIRVEVDPHDVRDTSRPIVVRLVSKLPTTLVKGATRDELVVPYLSRVIGCANWIFGNLTSLDKRRFPVKFYTTGRVIEDFELDLGNSLGEPVSLPEPVVLEEDGCRYLRSFEMKDGRLVSHREMSAAKVDFAADRYPALKAWRQSVEKAERCRPVFAAGDLKNAEVEFIEDRTETYLTSDFSWVTTNTVVKRPLTFKGKKDSAELKFTVNSLWKSVEVIDAVVSNSDGRVAHLTDKEQNLMDVGWAASAPRYPAEQTLVVNLPMVEIGSVISYKVVTKVVNSPVAFRGEYCFDDYEPIRHKSVRVNDFFREVFNPKRLVSEVSQPYPELWRDMVTISSNRFEKIDLEVKPFDSSALGLQSPTVRSIRDWMAKNIRIVGPKMYSVPLDRQLTSPERVLAERYATKLDYVRTLASLLLGAGFNDASVVLAADDAKHPDAVKERIMGEYPEIEAFDVPLCRVTTEDGVMFIGTEDEYAELGASAYDGADYFDPVSGEFDVVAVPDSRLVNHTESTYVYEVNEDGTVDFSVEELTYGSGVAGFRKFYSEKLPEARRRHFLEKLSRISASAVPLGELVTDVTNYPVRSQYRCRLPGYAIVKDGRISLDIGGFNDTLPAVKDSVRRTPLMIGASEDSHVIEIIRFPKGWTRIEKVPEQFTLDEGLCQDDDPICRSVTCEVKDGAVEITIKRHIAARGMYAVSPFLASIVRDIHNRFASPADHIIIVGNGKE